MVFVVDVQSDVPAVISRQCPGAKAPVFPKYVILSKIVTMWFFSSFLAVFFPNKMFQKDSWNHLLELCDTYGTVVRYQGITGVRLMLCAQISV